MVKQKRTISEHISNVFAEGESEESSDVRFYRTTAADKKAKITYDEFAENRRQLKEVEGEQQAIEALAKQLKKNNK